MLADIFRRIARAHKLTFDDRDIEVQGDTLIVYHAPLGVTPETVIRWFNRDGLMVVRYGYDVESGQNFIVVRSA